MNQNNQISFGYSINNKKVIIKIVSNEKIPKGTKYEILTTMLKEEEYSKTKFNSIDKKHEEQYLAWVKGIEHRIKKGQIKYGVLNDELITVLEESGNIMMPKEYYTLIEETITDPDNKVFEYFLKKVYGK